MFRPPSAFPAVLLAGALVVGLPRASAAADCPGRDDAIETDRPDVTNSSLVVPRGSVQVENGVNWAVRRGLRILDGSETRVRVGAFRCGEFLVDVPNYVRSMDGSSSSEFSEFVISAKRQVFVQSTSFSLSATAGLGVPGLGTKAADRGYTPYIQFPWSRSIADDWSVNGMVTVTWSTVARTAFEPTASSGVEVICSLNMWATTPARRAPVRSWMAVAAGTSHRSRHWISTSALDLRAIRRAITWASDTRCVLTDYFPATNEGNRLTLDLTGHIAGSADR
jgi:hypothetical protein